MSDLWGVASGIQQSTQDMDAHALAQQQILTQPLVRQELGVKIQTDQVALEQAKLALQRSNEMVKYLQGHAQAAMGQVSQGPGEAAQSAIDSHASTLEMYGDAAAFAQLPKEASEYYKDAANLRKNAADVAKAQTDVEMKNREVYINLLQDVDSPEKWVNANRLAMAQTGRPTPFMDAQGNMKVAYSPELVSMLKDSLTDQHTKSEMKKADIEGKKAAVEMQNKILERRLIPGKIRLTNARADYLEKHGQGYLVPKAGDVKAITDIAAGYFDLDDVTDRMYATGLARSAAERMLQIEHDDPTIPRSTSQWIAFQEAQAAGDFRGLTAKRIRPGTTPEAPMAAPSNPKDPKAYKPGSWYNLGGVSKMYQAPDKDHPKGSFVTDVEIRNKALERRQKDDAALGLAVGTDNDDDTGEAK